MMTMLEASTLTTRVFRPAVTINNISNNKDHSSMPCSCISGFKERDNISMQSGKQYGICKPKRVMDVTLFSGCCINNQRGIAIPFRHASLCFPKPCQVKREDSEGTLSSESMILDEQTLEQELQIAIQEENYTQAAKIRDSLKLLHEDSKAAVLAANSRFYNAFRNGDLAAMQTLWSKSENVCVVHPGVSGISGYELVMGSWEFVMGDYDFPLSIEVKDVQVIVRGDMGYVTCVEMVRTTGKSWGRQFATNVFEKINGRWFICVHHASHVDL
uniref:uncharacterized protein LOC122607334 n=1 Tax=Erigeron canadensis TaxID=72917 RepID=UPI001CB910AA|nr:uncharacterized protein LOC122607334 [Erigeron canadensis]